MNKLFLSLLLTIVVWSPRTITLAYAEESIAPATSAMKEMAFDDFLGEVLSAKIHIKISVPAEYIHTTFKKAPLFSSYWMTSEGAEETSRTGDLPLKTGWIYGELSANVSFDNVTNKFVGIDLLRPELARSGFKVLGTSSGTSNGYPIVFIEILHEPTGKPIYLMYLATLIGENVVVVGYRAPNNDRSIGDPVWAAIKRCVLGSSVDK